jgi:hypothetical protein
MKVTYQLKGKEVRVPEVHQRVTILRGKHILGRKGALKKIGLETCQLF